jgi:hypothetical protein
MAGEGDAATFQFLSIRCFVQSEEFKTDVASIHSTIYTLRPHPAASNTNEVAGCVAEYFRVRPASSKFILGPRRGPRNNRSGLNCGLPYA